jgi:hypothetical protein
MSISLILCDRLLEYFTQCLIECLRKAICLRIITHGVIPCDVIFYNKSLHLIGFEEVIQRGIPKKYMICCSRKLMTLSDFTSLNGIASAHLEKYVRHIHIYASQVVFDRLLSLIHTVREPLVQRIIGTIPQPLEYMRLDVVASDVFPHDRSTKCHD